MDRTLGSEGTLSVVVFGDDAAAVRDADLGDRAEVAVEAVEGARVEPALDRLSEADLVVPSGEEAFLSLARREVEKPILPVDGGQGIASVRAGALGTAIDEVQAGAYSIRALPGIAVRADGDRYRGVMDVMAVTAEAAKISEYQIASLDDGDEVVLDRIRADGVVAAAPAGTPGYGTAAGGPVLDPALDAMAVIPVGPFRIEHTHWVLELPISLTVVREEVPVSLQVDDREVGTLEAGTAVEIAWGTPMDIVVTSVSGGGLRPHGSDRDGG